MRGGVLLVVAGLVLTGCAKKVEVASDGGASVTVAPPVETPTPTGPTFVPPNGTCTVRVEAPPPAPETTPPPSTTTTRRVPDDAPPNHGDNRSWRVRKPLSAANHARGMAILDRVRPGITGLCDTGNFSPDSARTVLAAAGLPKAWVSGLKVGYGQVPPPGVYFYEASDDPALGTVCVLGDLRPGEPGQPGRVAFFVEGPIRDGGCDEPLSH